LSTKYKVLNDSYMRQQRSISLIYLQKVSKFSRSIIILYYPKQEFICDANAVGKWIRTSVYACLLVTRTDNYKVSTYGCGKV
jgi:hypothetical protein